MALWRFFRRFALPCSLVLGAVGYLLFANIPFLEPIGDAVGPHLISLMPVVLFALLYVTFCKIEIKEMRPQKWHFILQIIRTSLAASMVVAIYLFGASYNVKLVLEAAFICFICPTAAAVAVVTEKLGGSIGSLIYRHRQHLHHGYHSFALPNGRERCQRHILIYEHDGVSQRNHGACSSIALGFAQP